MAAWTSPSRRSSTCSSASWRKLEIAGARGVSIDTVWGQGYILRETEAVGRTQASLPNSIDDIEIDEPVTKPAAKKLGSAGRADAGHAVTARRQTE